MVQYYLTDYSSKSAFWPILIYTLQWVTKSVVLRKFGQNANLVWVAKNFLTQYMDAAQLLFHDCRVDLAHVTSIIFGLNIFDE